MKLFTSAAILALCTFGAMGAAFADGCSGRDHTTGTVVGAVGGAAIGGAVSHDVGGAIVGGVLGGVAGNAIARSEDCDRQGYQGRGDDRGGYGGVYVQGNVGRESEGDYWGVESYDDFGADYRHISENIQRGRENGFYSASQARGYYQQLQQIRSRADWQQRNGRFDSEDIEVRLTRLRQTMHASREYGQGRDYRDDRR